MVEFQGLTYLGQPPDLEVQSAECNVHPHLLGSALRIVGNYSVCDRPAAVSRVECQGQEGILESMYSLFLIFRNVVSST